MEHRCDAHSSGSKEIPRLFAETVGVGRYQRLLSHRAVSAYSVGFTLQQRIRVEVRAQSRISSKFDAFRHRLHPLLDFLAFQLLFWNIFQNFGTPLSRVDHFPCHVRSDAILHDVMRAAAR